jgi:hypothetical protein
MCTANRHEIILETGRFMNRTTIYGQCIYCGGTFYYGHECEELRKRRKQQEEINELQRRVREGSKWRPLGNKE